MNEEARAPEADPSAMLISESPQSVSPAEPVVSTPAKPGKKQKNPERAARRRAVSLCGWGVLAGFTAQSALLLVVILLASFAGGIVIGFDLLQKLEPGADNYRLFDIITKGVKPTVMYAVVAAYFAGDLIAWLLARRITRSLPSAPPVKRTLTARGFFLLAGTLAGLWGMGVLIGNLPTVFGSYSDSVLDFSDLGWACWPSWLMTAVAAPVFEELIFRKTLIDKLRVLGEREALLISSLLFGLVHQNSAQFFYAYGAGLMLGMLYLRTGRVGYTMLLHAMVNGFSVLGEAADLAGKRFSDAWTVLLFVILLAGIVCVCCNRKNPFLRPERSEDSGKGGVFGVGFIVAVLVYLAMIVSTGISLAEGQRAGGHLLAAVLEEQAAWLAVLVTCGVLVFLAVSGRKKRSQNLKTTAAAEVPPMNTPEG